MAGADDLVAKTSSLVVGANNLVTSETSLVTGGNNWATDFDDLCLKIFTCHTKYLKIFYWNILQWNK